MGMAGKIKKVFGDWMVLNRRQMSDHFFCKTHKKIKVFGEYLIRTAYDENGVPSGLEVYTMSGSSVGYVPIQVSGSGVVVYFGQSIWDYQFGGGKMVLCQNDDTAAYCETSLRGDTGIPVGRIAKISSHPSYWSLQKPEIHFFAQYDEKPNKIIGFYSGEGSIVAHRLNSKANEGFASSPGMFALKKHDGVDICQDAAMYALRLKKNEGADFLRDFLSSSFISRKARLDFVKEFASKSGTDEDKILACVRDSGLDAPTIETSDRMYFMSGGRYCYINKHKRHEIHNVSNFCFVPSMSICIGEKTFAKGMMHCDGASKEMAIDLSHDFKNHSSFFNYLAKTTLAYGLPWPTVNDNRSQHYIWSMIMQDIGRAKKEVVARYGIDTQSATYNTGTWTASYSSITGTTHNINHIEDDFAIPYLIGSEYKEKAISFIRSLATYKQNFVFLSSLIRTIKHYMANEVSTLYVDAGEEESIAQLLGLKILGSVVESRQLQLNTSDCSQAYASKHKLLSICSSPSMSRAKDAWVFSGSIHYDPNQVVNILPMILHMCFSMKEAEIIKKISPESKVVVSGITNGIFSSLADIINDAKTSKKTATGEIAVEMKGCVTKLKEKGINVTSKDVIESLRQQRIIFSYPERKFKDRRIHFVIHSDV